MAHNVTSYRIPFFLSVIMNINVMIGAGLFVNPAPLTRLAGSFGCLSYAALAIFLLPLVLSVATIATLYSASEGGLYGYIRAGLGKKIGLVSIGFYFVAKSISCCVLLGTVIFYLQSAFPPLADYPSLFFKLFIIALLASANSIGFRFGSKLQFIFMMLKAIPIFLVIFCAYYLFNPAFFSVQDWSFSGFTSSLPIALYTLIGFETCCSLGHVIEGGGRYLARVVVTSFLIVALVATCFEFALFGGLGLELSSLKAPMTAYFGSLFSSQTFSHMFIGMFVSVCIMLSVLGACYGILSANNGNIYVFISELLPASFSKRWLTKNQYGVNFFSLFIQCCLILFFSLGGFPLIVLTRLTVLGVVVCYTLVVCSLLLAYKTHKDIFLPRSLAFMSLFSCCYIAFTCLKDLW